MIPPHNVDGATAPKGRAGTAKLDAEPTTYDFIGKIGGDGGIRTLDTF